MRVFFFISRQAPFILDILHSSGILAGFEHGSLCEKLSNLPGFEPGISWSVVRRVIHCATGPVEKPRNKEATYPRAQFRANFKTHNKLIHFSNLDYHGGTRIIQLYYLIHRQLAASKVILGAILAPPVMIHIYANFHLLRRWLKLTWLSTAAKSAYI